jgi:outer membrane lipoprotein-sorting protein
MKKLLMLPKNLHLLIGHLFIGLACLVFAQASTALTLEGSAEEKGLAIATASKAKGEGWGDSTGKMKMLLRNAQGQTSTRELRILSLEMKSDGDKSLSIFDTPADVRNTKMLTYSHNDKADEQWLYLPALKRVKRISSKSKSGPFMGSEFAFEDLTSFEVEKFSYKYLGEEKVNGLDCYKSEAIPAYEHSGYSKQIIWLDKEELRAQRIEYYDRKGALLKSQNFDQYTLYLDKFWRAHTSVMVNHQTKKSTVLQWSDLEFNKGLGEADFHQNVLKRVM